MRPLLALLFSLLLTAPALAAPTVAAQSAAVKKLEHAKLTPAYAEAALTLARLKREAKDLKGALTAAQAAAKAFDQQVELHKALSEVLTHYDQARAERGAAREAGLKRDEAFYLVAELARQLGDRDTAIRHYALVVQSEPDTPLGEKALAALGAIGFVEPVSSPASPVAP